MWAALTRGRLDGCDKLVEPPAPGLAVGQIEGDRLCGHGKGLLDEL